MPHTNHIAALRELIGDLRFWPKLLTWPATKPEHATTRDAQRSLRARRALALAVEIDLYEGAPSIGPLGAEGAGEVPIMNPPALSLAP
ncbi:hypothetical protein MPLDJ20_20263 [Mesorhizobium plurifarium]|uniref:Uncharacterized protein n=1 Tax=Mesorhizobium plurifarium TaxID=69974 RepID=A0A090GKL1_MESPL|nr:hypothetical protein MPLDJ20_20263 [Mesorhizobium plurifarium]